MRTTIDLNDNLFRQAKVQAAQKGITFKDLVESSLRQTLRRTSTPKKKQVKFPLWGHARAGILNIPDDIAHRIQEQEDRARYESTLRR